jgi:hypothetical protein
MQGVGLYSRTCVGRSGPVRGDRAELLRHVHARCAAAEAGAPHDSGRRTSCAATLRCPHALVRAELEGKSLSRGGHAEAIALQVAHTGGAMHARGG